MTTASGDPGSASVVASYPAEREAEVALRDGSTVHVRPMRPTDEPLLATFLRGLSEDSRILRFFSNSISLEREARREATEVVRQIKG